MTMGTSETDKFCLSWSQFVPSMVTTLRNLHDNEESKDVTLVSDDGVEVKCHRFILNSNSGFFNKLFSKGSHHKDTIVYLTHIGSKDLKDILKFMYLGQVFLEQESLNSFMFAASKLMIQGLSEFHHVTPAQVEKPQEDIANYDYQEPQQSPTVKQPTSSDKGPVFDPIDVIQQQSKKDLDYDPIQDFIDGLPMKKESVSPNHSGGDYSFPVADVVIPQLNSGAGPSQSSDPISLQILDWNRGVDNEYVVTSTDSSVQSVEQKYYQCEKCDYKSTKMFNVKKHTAAVHDGVRYPCKFCDYKATETGHLRKHVRARHGKHLDTLKSEHLNQ